MHYRRLDPQLPEFMVCATPALLEYYARTGIPGGAPDDMPGAQLALVGGEWYWSRRPTKE